VVEKQEAVEPLERQAEAIEVMSVVQAEIGVMVAVAEMEAPSRLPQSLVQAVGERMTALAAYAARMAVVMEVS
jgi:hypothetical protein